MSDYGTVYWLTGLSGAGKSTIGRLLYAHLRSLKSNVVLLDGDALREVFGGDLGYTVSDRRISAGRNARLCAFLAAQGVDVICCTISMFEDVRAWNRLHNKYYCEVYLQVPLSVLRERNQKGLYQETPDSLVGLGVEMEEPEHPDLILVNDGRTTPEEAVTKILAWQYEHLPILDRERNEL